MSLRVAYIDDNPLLGRRHGLDVDYDVELRQGTFAQLREAAEPHADLYVLDVLERHDAEAGAEDDLAGGAFSHFALFKRRRPHARIVAFTQLLTSARLTLLERAAHTRDALCADTAAPLAERLRSVADRLGKVRVAAALQGTTSQEEVQRLQLLLTAADHLRAGALGDIHTKAATRSPVKPPPEADDTPVNGSFRVMLEAELSVLAPAALFRPHDVVLVAVNDGKVPPWLANYLAARGIHVSVGSSKKWAWVAFNRFGAGLVLRNAAATAPARLAPAEVTQMTITAAGDKTRWNHQVVVVPDGTYREDDDKVRVADVGNDKDDLNKMLRLPPGSGGEVSTHVGKAYSSVTYNRLPPLRYVWPHEVPFETILAQARVREKRKV